MRGDSAPSGGGRPPVPRPRALVVEDEPPLARLVAGYLEREGFRVSLCEDGERAVQLARELDPEVIVLDLMLPGTDGIEACRRIRGFSDAYIVMLTARAEEADKIVGLSTGADDYVTKPFSPGELMARVRAMRRRPRTPRPDQTPVRRFGDLVVDPAAREVRRGGAPVELTRLEFDLRRCRSGRGWCSAAGSCWSGRGGRTGWATSTWWRCTSPTCAASSATIPRTRGMSARCGGSATR